MKHLVVIDGFNFFFRAYYGVRSLTRSDGLNTNALYGFTQMLLKVVADLKPDMCAVALDTTPTFRNEIYSEYKAHRKEPDAEMIEQFPFLEPLIHSFGIPTLKEKGFEADDLIATIAQTYGENCKVTIVSSDKDLMQLVTNNVVMLDTMKDKTIGADEVVEKFGVGPDKVIEVQSLIGDSSDNIPGVKGIGPKGAAQLIQQFGTLENLYNHLDEVGKPKLVEKLEHCRDNAFMSKELVTLKTDVHSDVTEEHLHFDPTLKEAVTFLKDLEFNRLVARVEKLAGVEPQEAEIPPVRVTTPAPKQDTAVEAFDAPFDNYETVSTEAQLERWIADIKHAGYFAVDTETTSIDFMQANLVGFSLCIHPGKACYVPLMHQGDMLLEQPPQLDKKWALEQMRPLLEDKNIRKIGQNIKYDMHIFKHEDIMLKGIEDTMLMSFCLDGGKYNSHGMDDMAERHLGFTPISFKEVCGTGKKQMTFDMVHIEQATPYAAEDADVTLRLYKMFEERLNMPDNAGVKKVYEEIERPLVPTLLRMEEDGVLVDRKCLEDLSTEFETRLKAHEAKVFEFAGEEFNVASPKQLAEVLFDKMEIPHKGKSRSTNVTVLEKLAAEGYEIASEVLAYRGLAKLKNTYTEALVAQINPATGRVHTNYNQTGAATGRFSSSNPNLQNIPTRSEDGKKIRRAFAAAQGAVILCADYSQIELRLLAHLSESEGLQKAFKEDKDIHAYTAHQIFNVPLEEVTSEQRSASKAINFGLVYGMGSTSLARNIGVSKKEAAQYIENYFERYSGVRKFLEGYKERAHAFGYIETMFGRRVHFPDINAKHPMFRAGAERAAINAPLQGANADIIKMVMPKLEKQLKDAGFKTKMLLQVHDELVFEVPENEVAQVTDIICESMASAAQLSVPLKVGIDTANNWEDAH